jgi:hypothetical protein
MIRRAFNGMVMLGCLVPLYSKADWPEIPFPGGTRVESIGEQVRLNGVPMRMHRVYLNESAEKSIRFYRERLGPKLAEQALPGGERILAQGRGDYFITLRIRPVSRNASVALISVSDVRAARDAADRPLGFNLPADSRVLSDMESTDAGKRSRQLVFQNRLDINTNRSSLVRELLARGYRPDPIPSRKNPNSEVLYFQGDKREAQLTLVRKDGLTQAVMTTIRIP